MRFSCRKKKVYKERQFGGKSLIKQTGDDGTRK